jgi:hypothetical protein
VVLSHAHVVSIVHQAPLNVMADLQDKYGGLLTRRG